MAHERILGAQPDPSATTSGSPPRWRPAPSRPPGPSRPGYRSPSPAHATASASDRWQSSPRCEPHPRCRSHRERTGRMADRYLLSNKENRPGRRTCGKSTTLHGHATCFHEVATSVTPNPVSRAFRRDPRPRIREHQRPSTGRGPSGRENGALHPGDIATQSTRQVTTG